MTDEETQLMHDCTRLVRAIHGTASGAVVYLTRDDADTWLVVARVAGEEWATTESHREAVFAIREMRTLLCARAGAVLGKYGREADALQTKAATLREIAAQIAERDEAHDYD